MSDLLLPPWTSLRRWTPFAFSAYGLACLATGSVLAKEPRFEYQPRELSNAVRASLNRSLEMQALNARGLTSTVWNHHFYADSDELRSSGRAQLDRLARRFPQGCSEIFVQAAHDIELGDDGVEGYFARRRELDALRVKAVNDYLLHVMQGQVVAVQIHDRPPVGMRGDEAARSFVPMSRQGPRGLLSPGITQSRFEFGGSSGGGGFDFGGGIDSAPTSFGGFDSVVPDFSSDIPTGGPTGPDVPPPGGNFGPPPPSQ